MNEIPAWLTYLNQLRSNANSPSSRAIARKTNLSHSHVNELLRGNATTKKKDTILKIAGALSDNPEHISKAGELFDQHLIATRIITQNHQQPIVLSRDPMLVLADAINNLAAAIRETNR